MPYLRAGVQVAADARRGGADTRARRRVLLPVLRRAGCQSGGGLLGIRAEVSMEGPDAPPELEEPDDMRRVDFPCHPAEPAKVLDDWDREVHCLICGKAVAS